MFGYNLFAETPFATKKGKGVEVFVGWINQCPKISEWNKVPAKNIPVKLCQENNDAD